MAGDLPIPEKHLSELNLTSLKPFLSNRYSASIESARRFALTTCWRKILEIKCRLETPRKQCENHEHCDSMVLEAFAQAFKEEQLLPFSWPPTARRSLVQADGNKITSSDHFHIV
jgi:hypothetical protein